MVIPKDEVCNIWYETEEVKHVSDIHYEMFLFTTINPEVTFLELPKDLEHLNTNVSFGTREQKNVKPIGRDSLRLSGTMLPYQCIEVRWWDKREANRLAKNVES